MAHVLDHLPKMLVSRMEATIEILKKVPEFAQEKELTIEEILQTRLAPDMHPFVKQVQIMSDNAKGAVARLNQNDAPAMADTESTIEELISRLEKTIDYVRSNPIHSIEQALEVTVSFPWMPKGTHINAIDYVIEYLIPNFHFHAAITYAILRSLGMPLGKMDFINKLNLQQV